MKFLIPLLLIPALTFAQAPQGNFDEQQMFEQIKQMMLPMMEKSLPAMQQVKGCIQQSGDTQALNKCVDIMLAFQQEMVAAMGRPGQAPQPQRPAFEWSEQLKAEMLSDIEKTIRETSVTKGCLEASARSSEMDACMAKAGMGQR